ncbi:MAG: hypothetical protein AAFQ43_12240 [Bacteroidota bacterium]
MRHATLLLAAALSLSACDLIEPASLGCTDRNALNYDSGASEDDGSCEFSRVIFYKAVDGPPVDVTVGGQPAGTITAFYPTGPGNCSAPGNATWRLRNGFVQDWNAQSGPFLNSGTVQADRFSECIRVRVF